MRPPGATPAPTGGRSEPGGTRHRPDHPHVLVLMCDQMQASRMGCAGDGAVRTPFLDGLAAEGVRFTHLVSAHGQCVPSRASLVTGLYPHECGVVINYGFYGHQNRLCPTRHRTLAHVLRDAGYRTVYFGKSHFGLSLDSLGWDEGVDSDGRRMDDDEARTRGLSHVPAPLRRDYVAVEDAVSWLRGYEPEAGRPLFFTFSTNLPHPPFFHEPAYPYPARGLALPASYYEETFATKPAWQRGHAEGDHFIGDEAQARDELARYLSMISATDDHCGRVADEFRRLGIWDDTVVLFVSDHGDMMGAHRMSKKGTLPYDELYRVPCLLKPPAGCAGHRAVIDDLVSSVQLAGTVAALAGVETGATFPHGSLVAALQRDRHPDGEFVFFEHYAAYWGIHPFYGARTREWKYVRYFGDPETRPGSVDEELYHLAADPHELTNLAGRPQQASVQARLAEAAQRWWRATGGRDFAYYESEAFRRNQHNAP